MRDVSVTAQDVKAWAKACGADLVGIAPAARLDPLPEAARPRTLSPAIRSVVVVGHRLLRGALRGVEEGTNFFSTYACFGLHWPEEQFLSRTVYELAERFERAGVEAIPLSPRGAAGAPFSPDFPAMAKAAGLGDVGRGGFFLTPRYGMRQRFGAVFVDVDLEPDAPMELDFCDDCRACLDACPLGALVEPSATGRFDRDDAVCRACRNGAVDLPDHAEGTDRRASACGRACLVATEAKVGQRFAQPFRKRSIWAVPAGHSRRA